MDRVSYEKALKNFNKMYIVFAITLLILLVIISGSLAAILSNDVKVKTNSDLTYYLNISYDGIDKNGVSSSDTTISEIGSGYLYIEDKIPEGLEFDGFITTGDGTIGAVKRSDESSCLGKVIDDTNDNGKWNNDKTVYTYHGLHYNAETRIVSFTVKNLKAGCKLVVGVKTKTPKKIDDVDTSFNEKRRDFYTYASAREDNLTANSGIVHFYLGDEFAKLYKVSYEYTGDVPKNAPKLPDSLQYMSGVMVYPIKDIDLDGYEFNGWTSDDVSEKNNKFTMPSSDIVLKGSFKKKKSYNVNYSIDGDIPTNYVVPSSKEVYSGNYIDVDSLEIGTVIGDYKFMGWTSNDVVISKDGSFEMPKKDVNIVGTFEKNKYNVIYKFYNTVLPDNSEELLPDIKSYSPGDSVKLANIDDIDGYKFLGWYKDDNFIMPNGDVTIYGEWKSINGTFEPTITIKNLSEKEYYRIGDIINYEIVISNDLDYDINNITLKSDTTFEEDDSYEVLSDGIILIDTIESSTSKTIYSSYIVNKKDINKVNNYVEVIDASSNTGYELAEDIERTEIDLKLESNIKICQKVNGVVLNNNFQYHIYNDNYDTWVNLKNDECINVSVIPGKYYVKQILTQEYLIDKFNGLSDDYSLDVEEENEYEVSYINKYNKKLFFHSYGRSIGIVAGGDKDED